jgi:hypothetical protein
VTVTFSVRTPFVKVPEVIGLIVPAVRAETNRIGKASHSVVVHILRRKHDVERCTSRLRANVTNRKVVQCARVYYEGIADASVTAAIIYTDGFAAASLRDSHVFCAHAARENPRRRRADRASRRTQIHRASKNWSLYCYWRLAP